MSDAGLREFYSVNSATSELGLHSPEYCRSLLGAPDCVVKCKTGVRYLYSAEKVRKAKTDLANNRQKRIEDKGKRRCYQCKERFPRADLTSGICAECRARKIVLNFACHGDCLLHCPDPSRVCLLKKAIVDYDEKIKKQGSRT